MERAFTFEMYLIDVGRRLGEYVYDYGLIYDNIPFFKKCYEDNLSAYKALLFLSDEPLPNNREFANTLYSYLIQVGSIGESYKYSREELHEKVDYFKDCFLKGINASESFDILL